MRPRFLPLALLLCFACSLAAQDDLSCTVTSVRKPVRNLTANTSQVSGMRARIAGQSAKSFEQTPAAGSIDAYILADLKANSIAPSPKTTDWEFIRRVTLDLTGRIPAPQRVLNFVADDSPDKRAKLVEELLAKSEWIDKWTMYLGDLYQNNAAKPSTGVNRGAAGRNAFYGWIKDGLTSGKPYNQMAQELITAAASNNGDNGPSNFLIGAFMAMGAPEQDTTDAMAVAVTGTLLGTSHLDCLLCHNGRGHLDSLSLWGASTTRYQAWQMASFLSHSHIQQNGGVWVLRDDAAGTGSDYLLNTTSGNRPARQAPGACTSNDCSKVAPVYIFTGDTPNPGESYRAALARLVTGDFQFARASVNYIWAELFGRGIVDPPDLFDPARVDADNPPPAPWTLQPSNPRLLDALAHRFVDSGYNLKSVMREIVNSETYQLSSRYDGNWSITFEPYFARKFVRRLWAEEVFDAINQSSGTLPAYTGGFTGVAQYAMQFPETVGLPVNDPDAVKFLDVFLRGNRDTQPRKPDGSILQALHLMNGPYLEGRLHTDGPVVNQLMVQTASMSDTDLINTAYLAILSRYPSSAEMDLAVNSLGSGSSHTAAVQDLFWTLYNKVDFLFNY
jgi:hypothetical protein